MKFLNLLLAVGAFIVLATVSTSCKKEEPFKTALSGTTFKGFSQNATLTFTFGNDTKLTGSIDNVVFVSGSSYALTNNTLVGIFKISDGNNTIALAFGGVLNADGTEIKGSLGEAPDNMGINFSLTKQ